MTGESLLLLLIELDHWIEI